MGPSDRFLIGALVCMILSQFGITVMFTVTLCLFEFIILGAFQLSIAVTLFVYYLEIKEKLFQ